jgi:pimeloyl-ACP methyl ester carboxylesterase
VASAPAADTLVDVELRQVEIDGKRVRYRVAGAGPPVVLVHGLSGSWRWWSKVCLGVARRRLVYVLDLPRLGPQLGAPELAAWLGRWLEAVGLRNVDLVGHSLGGLVAAELAAGEPELVHRLALVSPAGIPCGRPLPSRALQLLGTLYDVRERFPTVLGDAVRAGPLGLLHGVVFVSSRDVRADLASVRAPALLIWGEHDRLIPARIAAEWQRVLPGSRLVLLPCGHVPMWEAPDELTSCLLGFLDEQLPNETAHEARAREVDRVRLARNDR